MRKSILMSGCYVYGIVVAAIASTAAAQPALPEPGQPQSGSVQATQEPVGIGEIVVTAQRREEALHDVPITVANLSSEQLQQANVQELSDIQKLTPALRFDTQGPFVQTTIRGIGTAIVSSGAGSNVGLYVDGFYSPNPIAADFQLINVDSVQVLKGAQGTLFGRNTTGGAILVTTSKPQQELSGELAVSYGRFNASRVEGYATTGVTDSVAVDVSFQRSTGDGYLENIVTGSDTDARYENWSVRTGVAIDLADNFSLLFRYQHQENDDPFSQLNGNYVLNGLPTSSAAFIPGGVVATRPREVSITDEVFARSNNDIFQLTATFDFDFATLTSYTQYRDERSVFQQAFTAASPSLLLGNVPIHDRTFSQELLLTSNAEGPLQWTAGAFLLDYRDRFTAFIAPAGTPFFQVAGSDSTTRTLAVFLDGTYEVLDGLFVTLGARYSRDEIRDAFFESAGPTGIVRTVAPDLKDDRVTPRVVLRYALDPQTNIYGSFTRGYKAAIYNLGGQSTEKVEPETINAFEVGIKHAGSALSMDLAGFYYDYKNLQVSSYGVNEAGVPVGIVTNAAAARIYGVDAQLRYQFSPDFELYVSGAYLNAEYKHFFGNPFYASCFVPNPPAACAAPGIPPSLVVIPLEDTPGFRMQRAPKFTASLGARYGFDLGGGRAAFSGNLYYTSKFFFDSAEQQSQSGYATLGLRAEWTNPTDEFTVAIFGENLTGEDYLVQALLQNFSAPVSWGPPATFGAELRVRF